MELFRNQDRDLPPADPASFTGKAFYSMVLDSQEGAGLRVYDVRFLPGARTHWHRHTGVQLLLIQEGQGYVRKEGEPPLRVESGDLVFIKPGERHWHGASPQQPMRHLAVNIAAETEWLEPVTEEEYRDHGGGRNAGTS